MNRAIVVFTALIVLFSCKDSQGPSTSEVGAIGDSAMIVTAHPLATKVGLLVLREGGTAMDAAIATQFALAVVYPRAGNIGGGGFALVREESGEVSALDFREKAPKAGFREMYQDADGNVDPQKSTLGHLAVGVPGSVAGMWALHEKFGTLPWARLVEPAISLAFEGFEITRDEAETLNGKQSDFVDANDYRPWVIKELWEEGDYINQPQLAATLSFIRDSGRDGFYDGIVADQIYKEMIRNGGYVTKADLEAYQPVWRDALIGEYKGHKIIGMPPPSSGGVAVIQLLKGAEELNLGKLDHNSTEAVHTMAELERRVFADRAKYLGDPDFVGVPVNILISDSYNNFRVENFEKKKATPSSEITGGEVLKESSETTHFSIVDKYGNAVAITTTLNGNYGSKVMVKDAGFFLNNEMDDFSAKPGVPNMFGLVGAEANAIAPEKRMLSSMSPTIVEKEGKLKMVVGTPGGATIITSVFQTIINVIDYEMSMQEAVSALKIHHQWLPDRILVEEDALSADEVSELEDMGHTIEYRDKIGRTDCILVLPDGTLEGGADWRGDDYAEGF